MMTDGAIKRIRNWLPFSRPIKGSEHLPYYVPPTSTVQVPRLSFFKMAVAAMNDPPTQRQLNIVTGGLLAIYASLDRQFDHTICGWRITIARVLPENANQ